MIRLGSSSITRAKILKNNNIDFIQTPSSFDEDLIKTMDPKSFCYRACKGKFLDLMEKYGVDDMPLLVADSVVSSHGKLLRKALNEHSAKEMLELQSNSKTTIITCMIYKTRHKELIDISSASYEFLKFKENDINKYIKSGQCYGKAGAIEVEGFCKPYIKSVKGYESCAMGLCIEKLKAFI